MADRLNIKDTVQQWIDKINNALDLGTVDGSFSLGTISGLDITFTGGNVRSGSTLTSIPGRTLTLGASKTYIVGANVNTELLEAYETDAVPVGDFIPVWRVQTSATAVSVTEDFRTWAFDDAGVTADLLAQHVSETDPHTQYVLEDDLLDTTGAASVGTADGGDAQGSIDSLESDVSERVIRVGSVAEIEAYSVPAGYVFSLNDGSRSRTFDVIAGDFSTELAADTYNGVYVGLSDDPAATTKVAKTRFDKTLNANWFGLPSGDTATDYAAFVEIEAMCFTNRWNLYIPGDTTPYDIGDNNFPFRNTLTTPLRDYGGIRIYGDGESTVVSTTSTDGADIFQLNAVENIKIDSIKATATLTEFNDAGCNGVSITNGGRNIDIDLIIEDLPYVDQTSYLDGGKALTIQPGASTNELENIKARVVARNVGYGFGMDIDNDALIGKPIQGIDVNLYCDTAYRGVAFSGTANTSAVGTNGLNWGVSVKGTMINCQQHYVSGRAWHVDADLVCINTTNSLTGYLASDTETFVTSTLGSKNEVLKVRGDVLSVDVLHRVGGTTNGGGVAGSSNNCDILFNVDYQTATTQFDIVNSGGNRIAESSIALPSHVTTVDFATLLSAGNLLSKAGVLRTKDLNNYNSFTHYNNAGTKQFGVRPDGNIESTLTTTSALGAYVGKKAEYDAAGSFLGYRPIYA